jgi:hypothetical protein
LDKAEYLQVQLGVLDNTTVSAHVFICNVGSTHITFILNLYKLSVNDSSEHFQDMSHNFICGNSLDESDLIVSLEITDLLFNTPNDFEIVDTELQLSVNINLVTDLTQSITHQNDITTL